MDHLFDVDDLSLVEIYQILERAKYWQETQSRANLNKFVATLFFEPSTRTRCSFEVSAKNLGCQVVNLSTQMSSITKGESLLDTANTLAAMGIEALIIRHTDPSLIQELIAANPKCRIINAGAGRQAHPTQALLDLYIIKRYFQNLSGLRVVIVGDLLYSRVASSGIKLFTRLGIDVVVSGPDIMRNSELERLAKYMPLAEAIKIADVVILLRVQEERWQQKLDLTKYNVEYGMTAERLTSLQQCAIIMHPGPFNRGVEISNEVLDHPKCKITDQVTGGVFTRMALLERILVGEGLCATT